MRQLTGKEMYIFKLTKTGKRVIGPLTDKTNKTQPFCQEANRICSP